MKNKILIKEQNVKGAEQFTNDVLKNAFSLGCWPTTVTGPYTDPIKPNGQVIYQQSQKPENNANPHVFDKPDGTREWRTTAKSDGVVVRTSKWYCEKLQKSKNAQLNPDQLQALTKLEEFSNGQIVKWDVGVEKNVSEGWDLMSLSQALATNVGKNYAEFIKNSIDTNLVDPKVWVKGAEKQFKANRSGDAVTAWISDNIGWVKGPCKAGGEADCITKDLACMVDNPYTWKDFGGDGKCDPLNRLYPVSQKLEDMSADQLVISMTTAIEEMKITAKDKKSCETLVKAYYKAFEDSTEINLNKLGTIKAYVNKCDKKHDLGIFGGLDKKLKSIQFGAKKGNTDYSLSPNAGSQVRESKEKQLKNLIRESLIETKKTKERNVLSEGKIVKARLSIISENVSLKTKKQKDKFFDELLSEMTYLNSQGFDKKIINEGFWDTLKGLFGHAPDGIMEYFKEYIAKWLVEHLTPMDSNGWLGSIVITAIGNLPIGDIPKLTDCNFLTKLISKSVAEGTVRKLTHEKGLEGPFYDILRNSIVDMLDETSLGSKIEEALGSFICPLLGGVKNKMNVATDTLKQKALATS
jgi:hypothetical protein